MRWKNHHVVGLANHADRFSWCWCVIKIMQMSFPLSLFSSGWKYNYRIQRNWTNQLWTQLLATLIFPLVGWTLWNTKSLKDSIWNVLLLLLLLWLLSFGCYQNVLDDTQIQDKISWSWELRSQKDKTMSKGINISQVLYNFMVIFDNCLDDLQYKLDLTENV